MGEILPFPFRQVGSAGQIRIGSLAGGVDIDIFFYFVTEENVGRIYYFSPHPTIILILCAFWRNKSTKSNIVSFFSMTRYSQNILDVFLEYVYFKTN